MKGLTIALNSDVGKANKGITPRAVWNNLKGSDGFISLFFCPLTGPFQRTTGVHRFQNRLQKVTTSGKAGRGRPPMQITSFS